LLFTVKGPNGMPNDLVGDGQKSGQFWAFDLDRGAVVWETQVGPGGTLGGLEWGSATDGSRIHVAETNTNHVTWTW
jgi:polyvinyl alcohol dehydrogenase (cytochrome)